MKFFKICAPWFGITVQRLSIHLLLRLSMTSRPIMRVRRCETTTIFSGPIRR
jgi:hypothetical protein